LKEDLIKFNNSHDQSSSKKGSINLSANHNQLPKKKPLAKVKICKLKPDALSFQYSTPVLTSQLKETGMTTAAKLRSVIFLQDHDQVESEAESSISESNLEIVSEEKSDVSS
jgi:hypothetical protein